MPGRLFSSLPRRASRRAKPTGTVPTVNKNCIVSGGISREPSLDSSAQPPQHTPQIIEYQNQRAFRICFSNCTISSSCFSALRTLPPTETRFVCGYLGRVAKTAQLDPSQDRELKGCGLQRHYLKDGREG